MGFTTKNYKLAIGNMSMLAPTTHFSPIRMVAYSRNDVEMEVVVKNESDKPLWVECDLTIPEAVSLAPDKMLTKGRMRVGIALPRERISKKIKIYGGPSSYPDTYAFRLTFFGFGHDGAIEHRCEARADLRCVRIGEE
jgi:hypothetical protein